MGYKFKVGDKVKVRKNLNVGQHSERGIVADMVDYAGRTVTILLQRESSSDQQNYYLIREDNQEFQSGDMIKCSNCEQENDYDSLIEIAKEQVMELVKNEVESKFKNMFKKFGK